jgi:hypothetical protein
MAPSTATAAPAVVRARAAGAALAGAVVVLTEYPPALAMTQQLYRSLVLRRSTGIG